MKNKEQKREEKIISEHNARILNEFQLQGKPDMPFIAYDERICLIPAMEKATKETFSILSQEESSQPPQKRECEAPNHPISCTHPALQVVENPQPKAEWEEGLRGKLQSFPDEYLSTPPINEEIFTTRIQKKCFCGHIEKYHYLAPRHQSGVTCSKDNCHGWQNCNLKPSKEMLGKH